jgi:peptidyl-prolyl cis-trans isomerase D
MSVIQQIRDKYARVAVVAIALSLLGFILMDALSGRSSLFGGMSTTIGEVDGKTIKHEDFQKKMTLAEENYKRQGTTSLDEETRQRMLEEVWTREVEDRILEKEYAALGITVTKNELNDLLFGANPPDELKQNFSDSITGAYDPAKASAYFATVKTSNNPEAIGQMNMFLDDLVKKRMLAKYNALMTNSIYVPKWLVEKRNVDNSQIAQISYVAVPYATISDSAVKITDNEIRDYMNERKKDFEQKEPTRSITYVTFSAAPSAADSAAARNSIVALKPQFDTAKNYTDFLTRQNSTMSFYDGLINRNDIQQAAKDSILSAPVGVVYGPYLDQSNWVYSKIVETRPVADTVKVRHVLVGYQIMDPQTNQPIGSRDDSTAKRLIDSIQTLHKSGTSFDTLVARFSDDRGSKATGGVYENVTSGKMVASFNDFAFTRPVGTTGIVKTDYGYHYIEVLASKGSTPGYKIAYLSRPISASPETEEAVFSQARMFAAGSDDLESFNANWEKNLKGKVNKLVAPDIRSVDYTIQNIGTSRKFVRDIFDADQGDVIGPERIGTNYIVAAVSEVNEAGLASISRVRSYVEPILRNKKKAEQIKKNIGKFSTLEEVSTKMKQPVQVADSIRISGSTTPIGYEARVVGATFNPANKGKVVPEALEGQSGVYVIRVNNVSSTPVEAANIEQQRQQQEMQLRQQATYQTPVSILRQTTDVKDYRAKFF